MTLRSDHIAGAAFVIFGIVVFAISGDLPFGTLSSPGAGMMPKLLLALMVVFGIVLMFSASSSKPFAEIEWSDGAHALKVVLIAGVAITLYQKLGFILTMTLLVFTLLIVIERKSLLPATAYSLGLTLMAWWLFGKVLKSPLETGILGF